MAEISERPRLVVVGAGISGAASARQLADAGGHEIHVIDASPHLGANCHTERDALQSLE